MKIKGRIFLLDDEELIITMLARALTGLMFSERKEERFFLMSSMWVLACRSASLKAARLRDE